MRFAFVAAAFVVAAQAVSMETENKMLAFEEDIDYSDMAELCAEGDAECEFNVMKKLKAAGAAVKRKAGSAAAFAKKKAGFGKKSPMKKPAGEK